MKHARKDYDRIQDPSGKIPKDEPVFLLRGQDEAAPAAVRTWANIANSFGASRDIVEAAEAHADEMDEWQRSHASKIPDLPQELQQKASLRSFTNYSGPVRYRTWFPKARTMIRWGAGDIEGMGEELAPVFTGPALCPGDPNGIHSLSTGQREATGREVYGGDLLCSKDICLNSLGDITSEPCLVVWVNRYSMWALRKDNKLHPLGELLRGWKMTVFKYVGNIFENPEMWKEGE